MSVPPSHEGGSCSHMKGDEKTPTKMSKWKVYKNSLKFINLSKNGVKNRKEDKISQVYIIILSSLWWIS